MNVETEKKYYCIQPEILCTIAEHLNFKKISEEEETDEYFTDIDSKFIKNRTCLRIRKSNNKDMEITYKGKSDSLLGCFCKLENNIKTEIENYNNCVNLFSSLGYYSYVEVVKKRIIYELKEKKYTYSIMIDTLPEIGGFVEFEIVAEQFNSTKEQLKKVLNEFTNKFSSLRLEEVNEPYRDIVAKHLFNKLKVNDNILNLCVCLDSELLKYEKNFYKLYKEKISKVCGYNVKWGEYKKNVDLIDKLCPLVKEYLDNIIFDSNNLLVAIELLKKIKYNKYFFTKANEFFCECFFHKLNIPYQKIIYISNNDNIVNVFNKNNISVKESIIINKTDLKENNSLLLVMINETK